MRTRVMNMAMLMKNWKNRVWIGKIWNDKPCVVIGLPGVLTVNRMLKMICIENDDAAVLLLLQLHRKDRELTYKRRAHNINNSNSERSREVVLPADETVVRKYTPIVMYYHVFTFLLKMMYRLFVFFRIFSSKSRWG